MSSRDRDRPHNINRRITGQLDTISLKCVNSYSSTHTHLAKSDSYSFYTFDVFYFIWTTALTPLYVLYRMFHCILRNRQKL